MSVPGPPTTMDLSKDTTAAVYPQPDNIDNRVPMQLPINKRMTRPPGMQLPTPSLSPTPACFVPAAASVSSPAAATASPFAPIAPGVSMDWQTLMGNLRGRPRCPSSVPSSSPMSSSLASSPYASTAVPSPTPCLPETYQFPPSGDYQADANYNFQNVQGFSKWSIYREAALRQEELARLQWERQVQEAVRQRFNTWWGAEQAVTAPPYPAVRGASQDVFGAAVAAAAAALVEGKFDQQSTPYGLPPREGFPQRQAHLYGPSYGPLPPGLPQYIEDTIRAQVDLQIREYVQQQTIRLMEQQMYTGCVPRPLTAPQVGTVGESGTPPLDMDKGIFAAAVAAAAKAIHESRGSVPDGVQPGGEHFRAPMQQPLRVGSPTPPLLAPMPSRATSKLRELPGTNSFVESMNHQQQQQQPVKKNDAAASAVGGGHPADGVRLAPYVPPNEEPSDSSDSS